MFPTHPAIIKCKKVELFEAADRAGRAHTSDAGDGPERAEAGRPQMTRGHTGRTAGRRRSRCRRPDRPTLVYCLLNEEYQKGPTRMKEKKGIRKKTARPASLAVLSENFFGAFSVCCKPGGLRPRIFSDVAEDVLRIGGE